MTVHLKNLKNIYNMKQTLLKGLFFCREKTYNLIYYMYMRIGEENGKDIRHG